jgi:hypothetical protein
MVATRLVLVAVALGALTLSACSRRSDAEGEPAPPPVAPPAAPKPAPEPTPVAPAAATGNNLASNTQSVNDGAFGPDYAPPPPAGAPSNSATPQQH